VVFFLREKNEGFLKLSISIALRHLSGHYVDEVVHVNRYHALLVFIVVATLSVVGQLRDQSLDFLLGGFEAKGAECNTEILECDVAVLVRVEEVESFFEVGLLLFGKFLAELTASLFTDRLCSRCNVLGRQGLDFRLVKLVSWLRLKDDRLLA